MENTEFRTRRAPLPGDPAYGPYGLALDPVVMDRYLRRAREERSQVAWDLIAGLWRAVKTVGVALLPHHDRHHRQGPIDGHYGTAN